MSETILGAASFGIWFIKGCGFWLFLLCTSLGLSSLCEPLRALCRRLPRPGRGVIFRFLSPDRWYLVADNLLIPGKYQFRIEKPSHKWWHRGSELQLRH